MLFAHSPDPKRGTPAQDYPTHIAGVIERATVAAVAAARHASRDGELLRKMVPLAAEFHDLGKLDEENQAVLMGKKQGRHLPVQHTDAGTAYLLDELQNSIGAALIRSHHIGLPDFVEEENRTQETVLRDENVMIRVNETLPHLKHLHFAALHSGQPSGFDRVEMQGDASLFFRIALSCLTDADHSDTAIHYQEQAREELQVNLLPEARLAALDQYVKTLETDTERSRLRSEVYATCRDTKMEASIASCDSPVGTGKTTAVMAHLLAQAIKRKLRRIIVVLPFTNIITQSVKVYRDALVLPGENPEHVVAELHHRADFEDRQSRQFTALWKSPIIVTTAVAFFETLASNSPATLRRLHQLPGSSVFVDEAHAALPAKLLPLAWRWMKGFADDWGCFWVLASGSLNRFWKIEEFDKNKPDIPEIMPDQLRSRLEGYETGRITYPSEIKSFSAKELADWTDGLAGPRIVILNTVQSAAVAALEYEKRFGRSEVEHLSTALTPNDRDKTLTRIKSRLVDNSDSDWTLIATSCVEAGVDFSFKTGVREAASLVSLLQTAGRVNRHGGGHLESVWTIRLKEDGLLKKHPGMKDSAKVLLDLISKGKHISPELCTEALKREIREAGTFSNDLLKLEEKMRFPKVENGFQVISADTRTVVVDKALIEKIEHHHPVGWRELQKLSVQIWQYRIRDLRIPEVDGFPGLYKWIYEYNSFIGYMAGILKIESFKQGGDGCIL
jgi:CRISPR-associated endonuclease/helicase Cas3